MKWIIGIGLLILLARQDGAFRDDTAAGQVPWAEVTATNYTAACGHEDSISNAEKASGFLGGPTSGGLDRMGDADTYAAATGDGRHWMVSCDQSPPENLR